MSLDDRYAIKHALDRGESFKGIAKTIGKDCTTVSKEVKIRRIFKRSGCFGRPFNDCAQRFGCLENGLCVGKNCKGRLCRSCREAKCFILCESYSRERCPKLEKAPYVCNGCGQRSGCSLEKALYDAVSAQREYEELRREARAGFDLDEAEAERLGAIVSPLLKNGQSLHHIHATNAGAIMRSERALYNYVDASVFSARNIDMPRKVRFKKRKKRREAKVDTACRVGRTYGDYLAFMEANPGVGLVEMDTVHGSIGGKALLTLHFVGHSYMIAILIDGLTANDVALAIAWLRRVLGLELFAKLFFVILTDNGSEFSDPKSIEFDVDGEGLVHVFYCDPLQSQQKGSLENNHTFIRRVLPKGTSFDGLCQDDVTLMMNHINSYARKALNDKSPMAAFEFIFGDEPLKKLGAELIPPDKIILRPSLLKH
jgi:IS30 family transposase